MTAFFMSLAEGIGVVDADPVHVVDLQFAEAANIAESANVQPLVALAEALGAVDTSIVHNVGLGLDEVLATVDFLPFNSDMVYSNIKLIDKYLDLFEFTEAARADRLLGYDPFSIFIPGDKEYQKAYLRLTVRAPTNTGEDRVGIGKTILNVDIEDIVDRDDTVAIPAAKTTINYNKTFQVEVNPHVTVIGGATPLWPHVTNQTLSSFDIELRDINSPFNSVAGTINWTAEGY